MSLYRAVQSSFWTDTKIADEFTPEDRYFYLYLFTNPHTNLAGCYEVSTRQMVNETGYSADKVEKLLDKFSNTFAVIKYSKQTKELLLVNWHKYNWNSSSRVRTAVYKEIEAVKCSEFQQYLMDIFTNADVITDIKSYEYDSGTVSAGKEKKQVAEETLADVSAIPLNDGTEWTPTQALFEEYVKLYPIVNIKQQFNLMRSWSLSNPAKRKTKSGVTRFVNSWLSREQDKGIQGSSNQQAGEKYGENFFDDLIKKKKEAKLNGTKLDNVG